MCETRPRTASGATGSTDPIRVEDDEAEGDMDELGASFLWRTLLILDTDSDYEDEVPDRMPGFINEPAYSTVYETLMDKNPQEYQAMLEALPHFIGLLQSDLKAILDRVAHDRGLNPPPTQAGTSAEPAVPAEGTASSTAAADGAAEGRTMKWKLRLRLVRTMARSWSR